MLSNAAEKFLVLTLKLDSFLRTVRKGSRTFSLYPAKTFYNFLAMETVNEAKVGMIRFLGIVPA